MIKWVVRLAIITSLLGIAGAAIIFIKTIRGGIDEKAETSNKQEIPTPAVKESNPLVFNRQNKEFAKAQAKPLVASKKTDNTKTDIEAPKPVKEKENKPLQPKAGDESRIREEKAIEEKNELIQQKEKLLSEVELDQLVNRIKVAKDEAGIHLNCVQLHISRHTNNNKIPSQIETYLRSHSFAIAGREIVSKKVKGILITPTDDCIRITVGSL